MLAIRTDQREEKWDAWRHQDGTPCEGRDRYEARYRVLACGREAHSSAYLSASTVRRRRGLRHCLATCRRLKATPSIVSFKTVEALAMTLTPCAHCAHDGNGRRNPARWYAKPYPTEPRCRPGGRREWLDARVVGRPDLGPQENSRR